MIPFFSVGTLFVGPAAKALNGADISFFIGLPVAGVLYWSSPGRSTSRPRSGWPRPRRPKSRGRPPSTSSRDRCPQVLAGGAGRRGPRLEPPPVPAWSRPGMGR